MQRAPVSGDMLVKLTLIAAAVGVLIYAVRSARAAVADLNPIGTISDVLYGTADYVGQAWSNGTINPASTNNVIYGGVNSALFPAGDATLGTWLYDMFNPDPLAYVPNPAPSTWQTHGRWNNPSAYEAEPGHGGAAFGIYPRPF